MSIDNNEGNRKLTVFIIPISDITLKDQSTHWNSSGQLKPKGGRNETTIFQLWNIRNRALRLI